MYISEENMIHPRRNTMSEQDWNRVEQAFQADDPENLCTQEEMEAYLDFLYDCVVGRIQTVLGSTAIN